jgi:hypothetical protein
MALFHHIRADGADRRVLRAGAAGAANGANNLAVLDQREAAAACCGDLT